MDYQERSTLVTNHLMQMKLVVTSILVSVGLLAGVSWIISSSGRAPAPVAGADNLMLALAPLAVALLGMAPAIKRVIFKRAEASGFATDVPRWLAAHRTAVIAASALREGAAILGFILSLLMARPLWSYLFSLMAFIALLLDWPRPEELE